MGVPAFYKWLVKKYPDIVVNAIEEKGDIIVDTSLPNPNGMEFDNLYLDMNGIIHPCFHPENHPSPPTTFQGVFNNVYEYIDRLFRIVRPRKLLYMAIDGVAPRAKMNQQRSRRFRTSKDAEIAEAEENRLRREFEMAGKSLFPKTESEVSDSNIITPGTQFMQELSEALQSYINQRLKSDVGWKDIKVILSDANVPGEGEHKIMSFIRLQRTFPDYNPNTSHCLYGLDADLIMLALATHEVHFSILREDVLKQEQQQPGYELALETSLNKAELSLISSRGWIKQAHSGSGGSSLNKKPYQFLRVWILREYLELDMKISDPPANIKIDVERIIDDFIFICFLTGNDFLPHMPTLEIHERAIDLLMHVYKEEFKNFGGYLVDMQWVEDKKARYIKLNVVEKFILSVGAFEEKIFKKRAELRESYLRRLLSDNSDAREQEEECPINSDLKQEGKNSHYASANGKAPTSKSLGTESAEIFATSSGIDNSNLDFSEMLKNTKELKEKLKSSIRDRSDQYKNGNFTVDKVKLGTIGWRERYYKQKFSAETRVEIESTRKAIVQKYTEGLCWVLLYYFSGVPSWTWFYPYHYGPFASDLKGLSRVKVKFQPGSPFKPFDQLMGVLPPKSAHALPKAYRALMISDHSNIIDFYPTDFEVDTDGKRFLWQGICKLPFIDEERLLSETRKLEMTLEVDEVIRDTCKVDHLFVRSSNKLGSQILSLHTRQLYWKQYKMVKESIDNCLSGGIDGFISPCSEVLHMVNTVGASPWDDHKDSHEDIVLCALYELPNGWPHVPRPLEGVHFPEKTISEVVTVDTELWHEQQGSRPGNRLQIETRQRKANDVGSGWGAAGRGKGYTTTNSTTPSSGHNGNLRKFPSVALPSSSSSSTGKVYINSTYSGGHNENLRKFPVGHAETRVALLPSSFLAREPPAGPSSVIRDIAREQDSNLIGRPAASDQWNFNKSITGHWGQHNLIERRKPNGSLVGLRRISDESSQISNSYGRSAWSVNNNFRPPYRNSSTSDRKYYEWKLQSLQPAAAAANPPGHGSWERWPKGSTRNTSHYVWQNDESSVATPSMQAHGKGKCNVGLNTTSATNWNLRDSTRPSNPEWYGRR